MAKSLAERTPDRLTLVSEDGTGERVELRRHGEQGFPVMLSVTFTNGEAALSIEDCRMVREWLLMIEQTT